MCAFEKFGDKRSFGISKSSLNSFEKLSADPETDESDGAKHQSVEAKAENRRTGESTANAINGVGQRIETNDGGENARQASERKKRAGEEEKRHDQKVYNHRKTLHVVQLGSQHCAESCEKKREQKHKNKS